jgi:NAD(P)-dependent dehydrogenase (short-subunit alcohol dehydrogenase family)
MTMHSTPPAQTVLLTGGTSGLGYACARTIAASHSGWHLVLASRNERQGIWLDIAAFFVWGHKPPFA